MPFEAGRGWDAHEYLDPSDEVHMVSDYLNWYITRVASPLPPSYTIPFGRGKG